MTDPHPTTPPLPKRADLIAAGELAPDFACPASDGATVRLSDVYAHGGMVLVFYPGDNTPVCTAQLCGFRDEWAQFQGRDLLVYGVNPAGRDKHAAFVSKHRFPFPLLIDEGGKLAAAFGCRGWFGFVRRTVYVLDRNGRVVYAQRGNPPPSEILNALR